MQKDVSWFFVAQAVPEIYEINEMLKSRGMCFFVIHCRFVIFTRSISINIFPEKTDFDEWKVDKLQSKCRNLDGRGLITKAEQCNRHTMQQI